MGHNAATIDGSALWAEQHLGVSVEWGGQSWTVVAAARGRVVLENEDERTRLMAAAAVRRLYVRQYTVGEVVT